MSEGTQNIGHDQAVVGEPASHPHLAVVVGEPPETAAPVLGEPAFANGLQDQRLILPPSAEETSANGVQPSPHTPLQEEVLVSPSHASTPSSAAPVEESPNLQQLPISESGIGEADTHHLEPPVTENPTSGPLVDEVSGASDAPFARLTDAETPAYANANAHDTVRSAEEGPTFDSPADVEITHIVDRPSEVPSEVPTENPFAALGSADEIVSGDTPSTDAPTSNASSTPDEISFKGLGDQQEEAPLITAAQEKQSTESSPPTQTDTDDGPLEGSKAVNEDVCAAELDQVAQGDILGQDFDSKEAKLEKEDTGSSVTERALPPELDQASKRGALSQGNDTSEDTLPESETTTKDAGQSLSKDAPRSEASAVESSSSNKDIVNENHTAPTVSELLGDEGTLVEIPPGNSSVAPQGTRDVAAEECGVSQPPAAEASFPLAANGNNGYQHGEDGPVAREQDLPEVDDGVGAEVEKPSARSKLPLIFTGLAIAAVGVAVASISRPH